MTGNQKIKLYMIRHGRTEYNSKGIIQGQMNIPLNEYGISQAEISAEKYKDLMIDEFWSSDLSRAIQDYSIVKIDHRLKERFLAEWQGQTHDIINNQPEPDNAESYEAISQRMIEWLNDLLETHNNLQNQDSELEYNTKSILMVTHEDCICALARTIVSTHALGPSIKIEIDEGVKVEEEKGCPNLGVSVLEFESVSKIEGRWNGLITRWAADEP
ncbi:uncharacterized protein I206_100917 [Kwoniella pini CBS 10737]|uniref:Phosphoglycerate mutase n=1 Tax=Kwoniella pini CBS 10737 TaxID=1296096 RepID=A0A1B9IBU4_9TREE|nr:uncharacterized protein I206_00409 [Kwoniella pini CBS 10737]OCF53108.1 hypothetical protein I206_00409 [Kwoniella pini CBS 10737]